MYAVEFDANINNGMVQIPQQYKELIKIKSAKFIVMYDNTDENDTNIKKGKKKMSSISIDTIGFQFDRNKANESY